MYCSGDALQDLDLSFLIGGLNDFGTGADITGGLQCHTGQGGTYQFINQHRKQNDIADQSTAFLTQLEGRSYEDAAAITGASVGTVKSRINRARQKLVEAMQRWQNLAHDPANERRSS